VPTPAALRQGVLAGLERLGLRGRRVALLDFPNYGNVGDSAIWLGERAALRDLGARVVYACHRDSYSRRLLERLIGNGCICLSGGGNFGDLYPAHQMFRERVIADFPGRQIIQLPQTIHFSNPRRIETAREVLRRHSSFTLMVRDHPSLELALRQLGVPAVLCPDMAFGLDRTGGHRNPDRDVIALRRADFEGSHVLARLKDYEIPVTDWQEDAPSTVRRIVNRVDGIGARHPRLFGWARALSAFAFDRIARERLERGLRILARGRAVITDRLHGHILCMIAGIPHVIVDTRFGKVRDFHDAWTAGSPLVRITDSAAAAVQLARNFIGK
jgi:exopolysaccharide biosynthesis predicted pyruvyltransferase EpsI